MNEMVFLGNSVGHTLYDEEKYQISKRLFIFFLPPYVTNTYQPDDMSMVSSIKVSYKVKLLDQILSIFYIEGGVPKGI